MEFVKKTPVEMSLMTSLREYKNPIVVFVTGILLGATFYFRDVKILYSFILCFIFLLLFVLFKDKKILLLLVAALIGYFYSFHYFKIFNIDLDYLLGKRNIYIGEILSDNTSTSSYYKKYYFSLRGVFSEQKTKPVQAKLLVLGSPYEEYSPGDIVQLTGVLKKTKGALLPGLFDERKYLFTKGISYILKADSGTLVFLDSPTNTFIRRILYNLRTTLLSLNSNNLPSKNLSVVNGIVFGSKASKLKEGLKEKIQNLGLSHITSASGFNVSILAFGIFYLFRLFSRNNAFPSIVSILAILFYSAIADFSPSIIRASVFLTLVLIGTLFRKRLKILPGIGFILLIFFLQNPTNILDVGLQLSVLAFLGLILFGDEATKCLMSVTDIKYKWLVSILLQSIFAQIMVVPLIVFYFHNIQLLGLVANIIAVPLASVILIAGLISVFFVYLSKYLILFSALNVPVVFILKLASSAFLSWINLLSKSPVQQIFLPNVNFYLLILIYLLIFYCLLILFIPVARRAIKSVFCIFLVAFLITMYLTDTSKYLKIFFLQRYNQDAVIVLAPKNNPVYFYNRFTKSDRNFLNSFLRLNNIKNNYFIYELDENHGSILSSSFKEYENKIVINYGDFKFDLIKNYKGKIDIKSKYVKLPILKKKDPAFDLVLSSVPELIVVNDYKKLSKKSINNINWLKSLNTKIYFLSETGTIAIVSDGKSSKVMKSND